MGGGEPSAVDALTVAKLPAIVGPRRRGVAMPAVVCSSVVPRSPGGLVVVWLVLLALNWAAPGLGWSAGVERI
ncbi:MAG: hypothetical protein ACFCBW_00285 [Candidatus Competibacterales bacterium]